MRATERLEDMLQACLSVFRGSRRVKTKSVNSNDFFFGAEELGLGWPGWN